MIAAIRLSLNALCNFGYTLEVLFPIFLSAFMTAKQLLHQSFFLLQAVFQKLLSSSDGLIPSGENLGDFFLLINCRQ
ncbi:hypothetical protein YO5_14950 [Stutzerimonas stutzeri TS44]|nr:hypothetical protein YO5_14950 [Stutzerimonas stutzeri TS44]